MILDGLLVDGVLDGLSVDDGVSLSPLWRSEQGYGRDVPKDGGKLIIYKIFERVSREGLIKEERRQSWGNPPGGLRRGRRELGLARSSLQSLRIVTS